MGLTMAYGPALPEEQAFQILNTAFANGIRHFDTAEVYAGKNAAGEDKHNEVCVGAWLKTLSEADRASVSVATKYFPMGEEKAACTDAVIRSTLDASLDRLGVKSVDLYYLHRVPNIDAAKSFATTCKALVAESKIKYWGMSEATEAEIRAAHAIFPLTAIQQEWSLVVRNLERDLLPVCKELGIAVVAYSPLARGLTSGSVKKDEDWAKIGNPGEANRFQTICPYLTGDHLTTNVARLSGLEAQASKLNVSPAQLSLAWLHRTGGDIVFPIPGSTKSANVISNAHAVALSAKLSDETVNAIHATSADLDVAGARYPAGFDPMCYEKKAA